ncbi:hypothetical protein HBI56_172760 [Parastagonospora nodorum]|nr:hypothetical protein HBH49_188200 [Parastagonospora nodorum]KAH4104558.1 hypothetical protein HBH46_092900 [Parastagonospora nodorum]KAH4216332.1 hypothetical protein HBI06_232890 [Parastagonospora nodorum]KAH4232436.1 hypothetical protein HBI05_172530 [Parastagonospora nodorum]KAH4804625.1 hypothetical protein HBH61_172310 [Parastagonospora nodorum]
MYKGTLHLWTELCMALRTKGGYTSDVDWRTKMTVVYRDSRLHGRRQGRTKMMLYRTGLKRHEDNSWC